MRERDARLERGGRVIRNAPVWRRSRGELNFSGAVGIARSTVSPMFSKCIFWCALLFSVGVLGLAGCKSPAVARDFSLAAARLYIESPDNSGPAVVLPKSGTTISIGSKAVFTEADFINADEARVELGPCLMLQVTPAAARDLYRLSVANQGRRLVLTVNDRPLGARRIDGAMADGTIFIFAEVPDPELPRLVHDLKKTSAEIQREQAKK